MMKRRHSNICYVARINQKTKQCDFTEVDGISVKNSYGLDLFRHKNKSGGYVISEGQTGYKLCEISKEIKGDSIIADVKEIDLYLKDKIEIINKTIEEAVSNNRISPRYTEPDKRKERKLKKEKTNNGLKRVTFFMSYKDNLVREATGYLYETNGLKFGLIKVEHGYRVTELLSGLYIGIIPKELPEDWRGFAEVKEYYNKKQSEDPQFFMNHELACKAYKERIEEYIGDGSKKNMYNSVKELKDDVSSKSDPLYYIVDRPNGERIVRKFSNFKGGRFNGIGSDGKEIIGLSLKGVKFLPNGFMIDGFIYDFRVTQSEIDAFEDAIINKKAADEKREREFEEERKKRREQAEKEFNLVLDAVEKKILEKTEVLNDEINMLSGTESTIVAELMKRHGITIPMKTHGWINKQLVRVFFDDRYKRDTNLNGISYSFYKGHDSKVFQKYLISLEERIRGKMGIPV